MVTTIAELPFREQPLLELLNLLEARDEPDPDYVGFGWARAERVWLVDPGAPARAVDDALVLGLHCPDDGEVLADDVELYFELDDDQEVTVLASAFFASWLPKLPRDASAIVIALCNPHAAVLPQPPATDLPVHFALGEVASYQACDDGRIELRADRWLRAAKAG